MKRNRLFTSIAATAMAAVLTFSLVGCGGKSGIKSNTADDARTFTYYIPKQDGVGGSYESYDQNPSIMYLTKDPFTYKTAVKQGSTYVQGEEVTNNVALRFESAAATQEQTQFIANLRNGADILDLNYAPETAQTMLANGTLMDLTFWVENYMPNYLAAAKKYGIENLIATRDENGNKRYLQIYSIYENVNWQYYGYQYRRDWLVEYGKVFNPETGEIGSQTFKEANPDWGWQTENGEKKWVDGIIFPSYYGLQYNDGQFVKDQQLYDYISGEYTTYSETRAREVETVLSHVERDFETYHGQWPATISDWEWMLDIFQRAVNEKFPDKGYAMALYQAGYVATGNLISSFGGTGGEWQKYDDRIVLGSDSSAFKTYVQTMNSWYQKGWIDKDFQSHTDLLWRTDEENVRQGYVGLYFGMNDQLFDGMDLGIGHTQGIYTEGMPYPINDKYGADENKYVIPTTLYAANWETDSIMVSTNAEKNGKDLAALFTMLDKAFTPEMAACKSWGLTSEMLAESQEGVQQLYKELGFPSGTSVYDPESKAYYRHEDALDIPIDDQYVVGARRMVGLEGAVLGKYQKTRDQYENYIFNFFPDKGFLTKSFYANLNDDQYQLYTDKLGQLRSSMTVDIPKFIKGEKNISDYDSWYSSLKSTLGLDNITRMLDNQYQKMKEK